MRGAKQDMKVCGLVGSSEGRGPAGGCEGAQRCSGPCALPAFYQYQWVSRTCQEEKKYSPPSTALRFLSFSLSSGLSRKVHTFSKAAVIFEAMKEKGNVPEVLGESGGGTATTVPLWERLRWGLNKVLHRKVPAA